MRLTRSTAVFAALLSLAMVATAAQPSLAAPAGTTTTEWTTTFSAPHHDNVAAGPAKNTPMKAADGGRLPASMRHLDPKLQSDLAAQRANPQVYDAYAHDLEDTASAAGVEDWMTLEQCKTGWDSRPVGTYWYYRNHYSACQVTDNVATVSKCTSTGCQITGSTYVRIAYIGALSHTARSFTWTAHLFGWKTVGDYVGSVRLSIEVPCRSYANVGTCTVSPEWGYVKTLDQWKTTASVVFTYSTTTPRPAPNDPHPADKIANFNIAPQAIAEGPTNPPPNPLTVVRCDNAAYMTGAGCTFTGVFGNFHISYNRPESKESVEFIWKAMHHLDQIIDDAVGLYVPGGYYPQPVTGFLEPLTRNYYGNTSRTKVQNECKRKFGDDYVTNRADGVKCDCDEYPFASTYQSANYDTIGTAATWAVAQVDLRHNRSAGAVLGAWQQNDHILDGDPFFVTIDDAPQD
ncbi:NucA/NucB deoxyribonuclease domain-containing protein [Couchioplanes azureus]|uniref:NucA/NucB deoxyribonuclease domain-containing protein n=1 Tax=Couchioplanes caeruleus TaxID=56438 RepID=UPI00166FE4F1|nr:hypothetical protein [Couchioplanes caeruleus]GGQ72293.1 hypothetical protein GCM10010166_47740 [Couchioplanes caeruleus subsp. azureus]